MTDDRSRRELFASVLRKNIQERTAEIQRLEEKFHFFKKEERRLEQHRKGKAGELSVFLLRHGEMLPKVGKIAFRQSVYARLLDRRSEAVADAYQKATSECNEAAIALDRLRADHRQNRVNMEKNHDLRKVCREQLKAVAQGKGLTIILADGRKAILTPIVLASGESPSVELQRKAAAQREQAKRENAYSLRDSQYINNIPVKKCYYIDASDSTISDEDIVLLTRFVNLKALNLIGTNVTYDGLEHLRMMPILRTLFIPTHLDGGRVKRIFWNNPNLIVNEPRHDWMDHWITVTKL